MTTRQIVVNTSLVIFGIVFGWIFSSIAHGTLTGESPTNKKQENSAPIQEQSVIIPPISTSKKGEEFVRQAQVNAATSTNKQFLRFRILALTFSYPRMEGAVWIDQGKTTDDGPEETYLYRYPYDPEKDSDVDSAGEYVSSKNTVGASNFSLKIYTDHTDEKVEGYIKRNYPDLDLLAATPFHKENFSGFLLSSPGGLGSDGGQILVFKSGHDVFVMTNESQMFTDSEFAQIAISIAPTAPDRR